MHRAQNGAVSVAAVKTLLGQVTARGKAKEPSTGGRAAAPHAHPERVPAAAGRAALVRAGAATRERVGSAARCRGARSRRSAASRTTRRATRGRSSRVRRCWASRWRACRAARSRRTPTARRARPSPDCELRAKSLREFFGTLVPSPAADADSLAMETNGRCRALAFRPLVWDMTALALRWAGKERAVTVGKIENVDPERHVYRASVRFEGIDYLVDVWLATDGGRLRLKLFDNDGDARRACRWCRRRPRRRSRGRGTAPSRGRRTTSGAASTPTWTGETLGHRHRDRRRGQRDAPDAAARVLHGAAARGVRGDDARPRPRADVPRDAAGGEHRGLPQDGRRRPSAPTRRGAGRSSRTPPTRKRCFKRVGEQARDVPDRRRRLPGGRRVRAVGRRDGRKTPSLRRKAAWLAGKAAWLAGKAAWLAGKTPWLRRNASSLRGKAPSLRRKPCSLRAKAPSPRRNASSLRAKAPSLRRNTPHVATKPPHVRAKAARVESHVRRSTTGRPGARVTGPHDRKNGAMARCARGPDLRHGRLRRPGVRQRVVGERRQRSRGATTATTATT